jgi:hypothetical protein
MALVAGLLTLGIFIALDVASLHCFMTSTDGLEADILSIAAASMHGQPVYHSITSPYYSYAAPYGPLTFVIYQAGLVIGGGRFWVLRAMLVVANLFICFGLYKIFRKSGRRDAALALMALPLGLLMEQLRYAFALRSDDWIVLTMTLAVWASLMESEIWAAVLTGFCAGLAIDFKVTVAAAVLLVLLMLYQRSGIKFVAIAAGVAALTVFAPFTLPEISLPNYIQWLLAARREGIATSMIGWCVAYAALLVAPLIVLRLMGIDPFPRKINGRSIYVIVLLLFCTLIAISVGAKPGGGVWHLWQLIPVIGAYTSVAIGMSQTSKPIRFDYAVLIIAFGGMVIALSFLLRDVALVRLPNEAQANELRIGRQQIDAYLNDYRGRTLQMGYGEGWQPVQLLRFIPVLSGQPYSLDGSRRLEAFQQRFPIGTIEKMAHCKNDVWLIPHGEQPFIMPYLFPQALHDTFVRDYAIEQRGSVLDAWVCKAR